MKLILFLALLCANVLTYGGQLIVGVLPFAPPYTSAIGKSDLYYGFCIDLMNEICKRINEKCQYKSTQLEQQLNDLRNGAIDLTFLSSTITATDNNDYIYSLPYLPSKGLFLVLDSSSVNNLQELKNKKIGVIESSYLKKNFLSRYASEEKILEYPTIEQLIHALNSHKVEAVLLNERVSRYLDINLKNVHTVGAPIEFGMGYGISALKKNSVLIEKINKALLEMAEDGTYMKIYSKYFDN